MTDGDAFTRHHTVMTHNAAAATLYTRLDSLLVAGRYVDEYLMTKLLS